MHKRSIVGVALLSMWFTGTLSSCSMGASKPVMAGPGSGSSATSSSGSTGPGAGTLTAGTWDDNLNFDFFMAYLQAHTPQGGLEVPRGDRVVIHVRDHAGQPVPGAKVEVRQGSTLLFSAESPGEGDVLFFPAWYRANAQAPLNVTVTLGADVANGTAPSAGGELTLTLDATTAGGVEGVDIAIVLDTTSSMGDEIRWLQSEMESISADVSTRFANLPQRWALVLYRDQGDAYVTEVTDFTTLASFQAALKAASSSGGGDYAEAVDQAVAKAASLSWSTGARARIAFHVADAPQHSDKNAGVLSGLEGLRARGVHYYPVAASGGDEQFEQTFRTLAQMTGGRYVFLTDDSGIGDAHKEPTIPCYYVTTLHEAMVRMISMELTGHRIAPEASQIIRTSGAPVSGQCTLAGGATVSAL